MINAHIKWQGDRHRETMNSNAVADSEDDPKEQYQVFVRGLPQGLTEGQLARYFERFDAVERLSITNRKEKSLGYGFVTLRTREGVQRVLVHPQHLLFGAPLTVEPVDPQEVVQQKKLEIQKRKIFAKGLFKKVEESDLWEYFTQFGEVESVNLNRFFNGKSKRTAFVVFRNQEDVVALLNNQDIKHVLKKRKFKIYESLSKKDIQEYSKRKKEAEQDHFTDFKGTMQESHADNDVRSSFSRSCSQDHQPNAPLHQSIKGSKLCIESDSESLDEEALMGEPGELDEPGFVQQQTVRSATKAAGAFPSEQVKQRQPSSIGQKVTQFSSSNCTTATHSSSKPSLGAFPTAKELEKTPGLSSIWAASPATGYKTPANHPGSTSLLARKSKPTILHSTAAMLLGKYLNPRPEAASSSTTELPSRETSHKHQGASMVPQSWVSQTIAQQVYNLNCCQSKECYEKPPKQLRPQLTRLQESVIGTKSNCPTCRENFCFRLQNMEEMANLKFNVVPRRTQQASR